MSPARPGFLSQAANTGRARCKGSEQEQKALSTPGPSPSPCLEPRHNPRLAQQHWGCSPSSPGAAGAAYVPAPASKEKASQAVSEAFYTTQPPNPLEATPWLVPTCVRTSGWAGRRALNISGCSREAWVGTAHALPRQMRASCCSFLGAELLRGEHLCSLRGDTKAAGSA